MAKRTRSSAPVLTQPLSTAPAAKKQKKPTPHYHCGACDTDKTEKSFPSYNPSPDCEDHLINTCKQCLKEWAQSSIESGNWTTGGEDKESYDGKAFGIPCPECEAVMRSVNIRLVVTKTWYAKFEVAWRAHVANITPGWRWCMAPDCNAGQVHIKKEPAKEDTIKAEPIKKEVIKEEPTKEDPPAKAEGKAKKTAARGKKAAQPKPEINSQDKPDICTCTECGARACANCDRPMHDGETCPEYQLRIKDRTDEEDASLTAIKKLAKKCPQCSRNIEKNGGCPYMFCTQCQGSFCWNCVAQFGADGRCKCSRPPPGAQAHFPFNVAQAAVLPVE